MNSDEFYKSLYKLIQKTSEHAEIKIISDEHCCKLLAWVYSCDSEMATRNFILNEHIKYAQKRLNLYGGEIPNKELLPMLQKYVKEIDAFKKGTLNVQPIWITEICKYYGC
jgi:hypothetical protein